MTTSDLPDRGSKSKLFVWLPVYAMLSLALSSPMSFHLTERLPDDADALQNLWILWWGATHLELGYPEIYEANGYYPHPSGLLYSEPQFLTAAWSSVLFRTIENRVLVFNLIMLVGLTLSAFAAHALIREMTGSSVAALFGAALFAFNAYHFSQLPRSQLIQAQWIPLALFALHRFFRGPSWKWGLAFGAFSLAVGLSSFYYLLFYSVTAAVLIPIYWLRFRPAWSALPALTVPPAIGAVITVIVALPYLELFERYQFSGEVAGFDLASYFMPPKGSLLYSSFAEFRFPDYFLGYLPLALAAFGALAALTDERDASGRLLWAGYGLAGVTAFVCSSGPDLVIGGTSYGDGPYRLLQIFGPFEKLREPARFTVLVYLVVGLFASRGLLAILRTFPSRALLVSALATAFALAEQWSPAKTTGTPVPTGGAVPEAYEWLAESSPSGPIVELPVWPFSRIRYASLEAYFSTMHERPIPFGKPSFYPPALELLQWELRGFPDHRSRYLLRELGFTFALVHPKRWTENRAHFMRMLARAQDELPVLAIFSDRDEPTWERYRLGGEQIHLVTGNPPPSPSRECDCIEIDRSGWRLEANGVAPPELAIDGDRLTKWTTGKMQQEGFYFEITFAELRSPARVEIEMAFPYGEFARNLEMNGYVGRRGHRVTQIEDLGYEVQLIRTLVEQPTRARLRYDLEPMPMERLRLFIHQTEDGVIGWSIPEIHVYEDAGP